MKDGLIKKFSFNLIQNHCNPLLLQPSNICRLSENHYNQPTKAKGILPDVAKLADAPDLGSGGAIHVGSTPIIRTFFI